MFASLVALPDRWLDRLTMYRLVIYYLGALLGIALVESWLGRLGYPPVDIAGATLVAVLACLSVNALFASAFGAPVNNDSALITGLILALIVGPAHSTADYIFLGWAATLAMASKYIIAWRHVHLFNPAAIALVITSLFAHESASWWIATSTMAPFVIFGGLLVVRRLRRGDLILSFFWATIFVTLAWSALDGVSWQQALRQNVYDSPVWFLAFVMLTEPVTLPPTRRWQVLYGVLAGVLVVPQLHVGSYYLSPELALVIANGCMIPLRSHEKRVLWLDHAEATGPGLMDFVYRLSTPLAFQPGQYMEWTLDHPRVDNRGKRRYFTLASSPTERLLRIGIKFERAGSSFKQELADHRVRRTPITAALVAGDFTLPKDAERKLAFIAGGIGVTPFRSMLKYLTDRREHRDIVMLYANRGYDEIIYRDVFQAARQAFNFRPVYVLSDPSTAPRSWQGETGRIDAAMIGRQIPDSAERLFYVSGSPGLVQAVQDALRELDIPSNQIKTDYFSGLAG